MVEPMFYKSQLFVPGNRPERFEKACAAGADIVCIDLEDAVAPKDKEATRRQVLDWLAQTEHKNVGVRINAIDTDFGLEDIVGLSAANLSLPFVMVPKVSGARDIAQLDKAIPEDLGSIFPIIESAKGLVNCDAIFAHERVMLALFGGVDFASDMNCDMAWETLLYARSRLAASAVAHDVLLFDSPHIDVRNLDDCEASTRKAKALGIHARSAIHPAQIERIHAALKPSDAEVEFAERVLEAFENSGGNVALLDGVFIEEPVVKKARRTLSFFGR